MKRFNLISLLFLTLLTLTPTMASADIGGLTKCSESPAFTKRLNASVKKLEQRLSQYEVDSPKSKVTTTYIIVYEKLIYLVLN